MSSINIVFQEKGKQNVIMKGNQKMSVSELINAFYKKICASKKDKMTKKFVFGGNEISPDDGTLLSELGMKDYSVVEIQTTEQMAKAPKEEPVHQEPPQEEEQPQEEIVQEEPPKEEQPQEEEQPKEEEQPQEEAPQEEEQPQEEIVQEEQPHQEEQQDDDWD